LVFTSIKQIDRNLLKNEAAKPLCDIIAYSPHLEEFNLSNV